MAVGEREGRIVEQRQIRLTHRARQRVVEMLSSFVVVRSRGSQGRWVGSRHVGSLSVSGRHINAHHRMAVTHSSSIRTVRHAGLDTVATGRSKVLRARCVTCQPRSPHQAAHQLADPGYMGHQPDTSLQADAESRRGGAMTVTSRRKCIDWFQFHTGSPRKTTVWSRESGQTAAYGVAVTDIRRKAFQ
jgi:hypothetical protein